MRKIVRIVFAVLALNALGLSGVAHAFTPQRFKLPVPKSQEARALLKQQRQAGPEFRPVKQGDGTFAAFNPAEGLSIEFEHDHVRVQPADGPSLNIALRSMGRSGTVASVTTLELDGDTVLYRVPNTSVWYRNGPLGLQQGFVVASPPAADGRELLVGLDFDGPYLPYLKHDRQLILHGEKVSLHFGSLFAWDARGVSLPARFAIAGTGPAIVVDTREAAFPVYIDPIISVNQMAVPPEAESSRYGTTIDIDGDLAIVGARSLSKPGVVYLFRKSGRRWTIEAILQSSELGSIGRSFGRSVRVSGNTVIISAIDRIYVFVHTESGWVEQAILSWQRQRLRSGVLAIEGDRIVSREKGEEGRVLVFKRSEAGDWDIEAVLQPSLRRESYGRVEIRGDVILFGSFYITEEFDQNGRVDQSGRVFVFRLTEGEGWVEEAILAAPEPTMRRDYFGGSFAFIGESILVGSRNSMSSPVIESGKAHLFEFVDGGWRESTQFEADEPARFGHFGVSVTGDETVVIATAGMRRPPDGLPNGPAAYIFREEGGEWLQQYQLVVAPAPVNDRYALSARYSDGVAMLRADPSYGSNRPASVHFFDLEDFDMDNVLNEADNCPEVVNADQLNRDGDAAGDNCDGCPDDPGKTAPGICGCGVPDDDSDGDGAVDCADACPEVAGLCGCGAPDADTDADSDSDGTPDCLDGCPLHDEKTEPGQCGCGVPDDDADEDGTADCLDRCPESAIKTLPGECGCDTADDDPDIDGVPSCFETCPEDPFKTEPGLCGCGTADDDTDEDGTLDCLEECDEDPAKTEPGRCGCGVPEDLADTDGDGELDCTDACPADPEKTEPGLCDCGVPEGDGDLDGDGVDCGDACPTDPEKTAPGLCGCNQIEDPADDDGDGAPNCLDACPQDAEKTEPGICGCGVPEGDGDQDGDGVDCGDACPEDSGKTEAGQCGCGVPEDGADDDGDGTLNCFDACPQDAEKTEPGLCGCGAPEDMTDGDGDGTLDCVDGCPEDAEKTEPGACGCGLPEGDGDLDGDGVDCDDACPEDANKAEPGVCGCGIPEDAADDDGDGVPSCLDACPEDANKTEPDVCGCGTAEDPTDSDGDGVLDCVDRCPDDPTRAEPGVYGCKEPPVPNDDTESPVAQGACGGCAVGAGGSGPGSGPGSAPLPLVALLCLGILRRHRP